MSSADEESLIVREGKEADCNQLAENNRQMAKDSEHLDLDIETLRAGAHSLLTDRTKGVWYVIEVQGRIVAQLTITYEWSDWRNVNMWWIQSVYVQSQYRRRGLFKKLYDHVKAEAAAAGAGGLRLYVDKDNTRAQATYEALGMKSHYLMFEDSFKGY